MSMLNHMNPPHKSEASAVRTFSHGMTRNVVRIVIAAIALAALIAVIWRPAGDAIMLLAANAVRLPAGALMLLALELIATNLPIIIGVGILIAVIIINGIRLRRRMGAHAPHAGRRSAASTASLAAAGAR